MKIGFSLDKLFGAFKFLTNRATRNTVQSCCINYFAVVMQSRL